MTLDQTFEERYDALQSQWRRLAIDHGHHYFQYLPPRSPVDYVLVAKMTSISEKAASETPPGRYPDVGPPGFNMHVSIGDLILNYGAHRHLCKEGETYYLTDLSKCAIPPKYAKGKLQRNEFSDWYPSLLKELELVAKPDATVVPVGSATGNFLKGQPDFSYRLTEPILHWSKAAVSAAKMASSLFPDEWEEFRQSSSWEDLRASTEEILTEAGLARHMDDINRKHSGKFGDMQIHYMFTYKKELTLRGHYSPVFSKMSDEEYTEIVSSAPSDFAEGIQRLVRPASQASDDCSDDE